MSEPHELEERCVRTAEQVAGYGYSDDNSIVHPIVDNWPAVIRAVLSMVRQEQEKMPTRDVRQAARNDWATSDADTVAACNWAAMIRAWWLSHTAPQEK